MTGFAVVAPDRIVPPPAFHAQLVGDSVAVAEKATGFWFVVPLFGAMLWITGVGKLIETVSVAVSVTPEAFVTVTVML